MNRNQLFGFILMVQTSCSAHTYTRSEAAMAQPERVITYLSSDRSNGFIVSPDGARFGDPSLLPPSLWSVYEVRTIEAEDHVQCVSIGPPDNSVEFAIKRPVRAGDRYRCLNTSFTVTHCIGACRSAVVAIDRPLSGGAVGTRKAYMIVDTCLGLLVTSEVADLSGGIPHNAAWLRGDVGILADERYPGCSSF